MHGTVWRAEGLRIEQVHVPAGTRLRAHGHEHLHLCHVQAGAFEERDGSAWRRVAAGTLRSSPAGDEHELRFPIPTTCLLVLFDGAPLATAPPAPGARLFLRNPRVAAVAAALAGSLRQEPPNAFEIATLALELVAAGKPGSTPRTPPRWLTRLRDRLLDDPARPPTTAELADRTGLHPVYVARAFRSHYGMGVGEFARLARAEKACSLLRSSDASLARLAVRTGYADQSHMTRELKRVFGSTPARLRNTRHGTVEVASLQDL